MHGEDLDAVVSMEPFKVKALTEMTQVVFLRLRGTATEALSRHNDVPLLYSCFISYCSRQDDAFTVRTET